MKISPSLRYTLYSAQSYDGPQRMNYVTLRLVDCILILASNIFLFVSSILVGTAGLIAGFFPLLF